MGEQKRRFSFRLPWSQAPRPAAVTRSPTSVTKTKKTLLSGSETQSSIQPNSNPTSPAQRPPFRPTGVAPAQPSPRQAQTSPKGNSQSTQSPTPTTTQTTLETQSPAQLTAAASTPTSQSETESKIPSKTTTNSTPITTIPDKMPPSSPPRKPEAQNTPQTEASPKTESQPSSPSRAGLHPLILSEPLSSPRASSVSRDTSHPSPPSHSPPRSRATSQPRSPSLVSSQSQAASHPPSRARPKPPTFSQVIHEPSTAVKPSGKTSSIPSESLTATNVQPRAGKTAQTSSPKRVINSVERSQPIPQEQNQTMSPPKSLDAAIQLTAAAAQPLEYSSPMVAREIPSTKKKSHNNDVGFYPKTPTNSMETENRKESENTTTVVYDASDSLAHTKEKPITEVQTEEKQLENQPRLPKKQELNEKTSIKGRRTKTMILHPKDTIMVSESQQKPTTSNGGHFSLQERIRNDISKLAHRMTVAHPEQPMDEKSVSVITLIGENQGASMRLGSEATKRESEVHIAEATSDDGEESSRRIMTKDANTKEDQVTKAYLNSNSQSLNNSMLINCSIIERNPGVHLTLSGQPTEPIKSNDKSESLEACKAEVNITPSHKLIYEPTIRRRCVGGLFMEPTDSDPDNPEKPRHHGCRYSCRDKNKDKDVDAA